LNSRHWLFVSGFPCLSFSSGLFSRSPPLLLAVSFPAPMGHSAAVPVFGWALTIFNQFKSLSPRCVTLTRSSAAYCGFAPPFFELYFRCSNIPVGPVQEAKEDLCRQRQWFPFSSTFQPLGRRFDPSRHHQFPVVTTSSSCLEWLLLPVGESNQDDPLASSVEAFFLLGGDS